MPEHRHPSAGHEDPPPGATSCQPPWRAIFERDCKPSGKCRASTPARHSNSQWAVKRDSPPEGRAPGEGEYLNSDIPYRVTRQPPRGAPLPASQCAMPARSSVRCGVGSRSQTRTPCAQGTSTAGRGCTPHVSVAGARGVPE